MIITAIKSQFCPHLLKEIKMSIIDQYDGENFTAYHSDCVEFAKNLPDNSVDFCVYSPPFSSLYIYSESIADMGNVASDEEFIEQYRYLVREKKRFLRAGRLTAIHVKDLVYYQGSSERGTSGIRPFSDMCTKVHLEEGFDLQCRITIYRDPVLERSKTNAHGLLYKSFKGDASFCRVGMPEYLLVFRKWAQTEEELAAVQPVKHVASNEWWRNSQTTYQNVKDELLTWQDLASPVWRAAPSQDLALPYGSTVWNYNESGKGDGDMPATDVLNVHVARDEKAERHLCPMPLNVTDRAIDLWTNEGDIVYSPFMGIGSEGVVSLRKKRKFIGTELHPTYYNQAVKNLKNPNLTKENLDLFDLSA